MGQSALYAMHLCKACSEKKEEDGLIKIQAISFIGKNKGVGVHTGTN